MTRINHARAANAERRAAWHDVLARALRASARKQLKLRRRFGRKQSVKCLHDVRIEARRLLAMVALTSDLLGKRFRKTRRLIKACLRATGKLRDAQVQLRLVDALRPDFPELRNVRRQLRCRVSRATERACRRLDRRKRKLSRAVKAAAVRLEDSDSLRAHEAALRRVLAALVRQATGLMAAAGSDEAHLHEARVALKRLRYTLEVVGPVVPHGSGALLHALRQAQDAMGEAHDYDVLAAMLKRHAAKRRKEGRRLRRVEKALAARRRLIGRRLLLAVATCTARLQRTPLNGSVPPPALRPNSPAPTQSEPRVSPDDQFVRSK